MPYSARDRIGYWLERRPWWFQRPFMAYNGVSSVSGKRMYVNRINKHLVVRSDG